MDVLKITLGCAILISSVSHATTNDETQCIWRDTPYQIGDTIFSKDDRLIDNIMLGLKERGVDVKNAQVIAAGSDWAGFALRCTREMIFNTDTGYVEAGRSLWVSQETHEDVYSIVQDKP